MNSNLKRKSFDIYRKNKDELLAFLFFSLPGFVYKNLSTLSGCNIPVFNFHSVQPKLLEEQFKYLTGNNYKTINSDLLFDVIIGQKKISNNTIVLTFDDGRKSLWTIAFPLLMKYDLVAISFIVPSVIKSGLPKSATLEDVWTNHMSLEDLEKIEVEIPFINWNEIYEMHKSGLVDFQSHSMYHASVFKNKKLIDFVNPRLKPSFLTSTLNPLGVDDIDDRLNQIEYGFPLYEWESNLTSKSRYIGNKNVNVSCMEYVKSNGGVSFFDKPKWRKELESFYSKMNIKYGRGTFQKFEERLSDIKKDLLISKKTIEDHLNKTVKHLCLPWFQGNELSVELSKEIGYSSIYWGIKKMQSINYIGDDPLYIKRINDNYIFSLPGKNRKSLPQQVINKIKDKNHNLENFVGIK